MKNRLSFLVFILLLITKTTVFANDTILKEQVRELLSDKENLYQQIQNITNKPLQTEKIVGGTTASRNEFTEYTAVLFVNSQGQIIGICGGTLIASNKVLTAAHCVEGRLTSRIFVVPGFYSFNDDQDRYNILGARTYRIHPSYNGSVVDGFDIAVITLDGNANSKTAPIYSGSSALSGRNASIIGLGQTSASSSTTATLRKATVPIVSNNVCQRSNTGTGINILNSMICAGLARGGRGTCPGDSGGPLFVNINNQRVQVGITSFGIPCAQPNAYDVYTRTRNFISFIRQQSPNTQFVTETTTKLPSNAVLTPPIMLLLDED